MAAGGVGAGLAPRDGIRDMTRYIALLRAINVGGHTVKMDHLRRLFEELDFANVETFIASGNVIFDAPSGKPVALERRIAAHLRESLGHDVATFLRSGPELAAVAAHQPFDPARIDGPDHALYVSFVGDAIQSDAESRILAHRTEYDEFHVRGRELFWLTHRKLSESTFTGVVLERALGGKPATTRNITTVRRLAAKYCGTTSA
jgi:uncharacterized protein (DUF1697 family)